jgi:predicted HAD superfamily Cof-like phosphohydrolase
MTNANKVKLFMESFGQEVKSKPEFPSDDTVKLRIELISEELQELVDACNAGDIIEVADALTDILYVTYGAAHSFGIPIDECFKEVQRSNMSKLGEDGKPIYREDGKVMKGPNYSVPNLKNVLQTDYFVL